MQRKDKGPLGEQTALDHLLGAGLTLIERNYSCKLGEVDLIMTDQSALAETLVFFEVRYRNTQQFGGAAASVDAVKQKKLIRTAHHFLKTHPKLRKLPARFDVIALSGKPAEPDLRWIKQAFQA
ncbi:MAG: YraN family protein [Pseudomonadales bacterium]|nr:YraN family protein [Pseudomonadales bacterium]